MLQRVAVAGIPRLLRRGLAGRRPRTDRQRRRALARAAAAGLAAPVFALDGLPDAMRPPSPTAWDSLGSASVVVAGDRVPVAAPGPTTTGVSQDLLLRRSRPYVRSTGVVAADARSTGDDLPDVDDVREAARRLGVPFDGPLTSTTIQQLRAADAARATPLLRDLGIVGPEEVAAPHEVRAAAMALGTPAHGSVSPGMVDAVLAAGEQAMADRRLQDVRPYAQALGLPVGSRVDAAELDVVAEGLGVDLPPDLGGSAPRRLHQAWLQSLSPLFERIGQDYGTTVNDQDVAALARALGADLDEGVGPAQLHELQELSDSLPVAARPFAAVDGLRLDTPSRTPVRIGFHESASSAAARLDDLGHDVAFTMPSRDRDTDARSAVDVAVPRATPVLAPVSGTVVESTGYELYGRYPDERVRIRPDAAPDLVVTMLHVTGARVSEGDRVTAGAVVADRATLFPFASQIDEWVGRVPHVHLEVRPDA